MNTEQEIRECEEHVSEAEQATDLWLCDVCLSMHEYDDSTPADGEEWSDTRIHDVEESLAIMGPHIASTGLTVTGDRWTKCAACERRELRLHGYHHLPADWNRWDIAAAWRLWLASNYAGQWSREYARLCRLDSHISGRWAESTDDLGENAKRIYSRLAFT